MKAASGREYIRGHCCVGELELEATERSIATRQVGCFCC